MTGFRPSAVTSGNVLTVSLRTGHADRQVNLDVILDQTDFGDVVGVEILDLRRQLADGKSPPSPVEGYPRWAYDNEIDAFYVHIADGPAPIQKTATSTAFLDDNGVLTSLVVTMAVDS